MRSLRVALIFIGVAGLASGLLAVAVIAGSHHQDAKAITIALPLAAAWSFIGTGLFAWSRRPHNRTGALMTGVGFGWFLAALSTSDTSGVFIVGVLTGSLCWAILAHLLLAFPTGRLETRGQRRLIAGIYLVATVIPAPALLLTGARINDADCPACPDNPLAIADVPWAATAITTFTQVLALALLAVLVGQLVARYRGLRGSSRDAVRPVLAAGSVTISALALSLLAQAAGLSDPYARVLWIAALLGLIAVPWAFLLGLLRSRFARAGAVGELVATLGEQPAFGADIRAALAGALGDPSLQFAYWLPDRGLYVDDAGREVRLPADDPARRSITVEHDGELIAAIVYNAALEADAQLVRAAGSAAALALKNQRLEAELRAKVEELRASRARIVESADTTRREIERDLHDGAQQHLVSMALTLRLAQRKLAEEPAAAGELLEQAIGDLTAATDELRELARGIHPAILTDRGLAAALDALVARSTVPVTLEQAPAERLPAAVESAAYFVVAEALTNVARYAQATRASVSVTRANGVATVEVADDGVGGATAGAGTGLRGLQDRVAALDGTFTIESSAGRGTTIKAVLPCA